MAYRQAIESAAIPSSLASSQNNHVVLDVLRRPQNDNDRVQDGPRTYGLSTSRTFLKLL